MIKIQNKQDCCGCSACVQRCPKHCISMKEDEEGFLYPVVDETLCIDCGLCEKVCPIINRPEKLPVMKVLAVKNRNEEERMASSSGGVFIAFAKKVIEQNGVVFGAVFDGNWEVKHTYSETLDGVKPMMGSKYVQSRIGESFSQAERFLKEGRKVLFTGSPCQITALHNYLRKDYPNLLSVDFLCHGVPSPGVWRKYLEEMSSFSAFKAAGKNSVLSSSIKSVPVITGIEFRDKTLHGWKKYSFVVRGSAPKADKNTVLLSDIHYDNPYMKGFLADVYLRPSCYHCKCKNGVSHSDLTIADYWGINQLMPDFDDDKGVGLVLLNTDKGKAVFDTLDMEVRVSSLSDAQRFNGGFKEDVKMHPKHNLFFKRFVDYRNLAELIERTVHKSLYRIAKRKIKNIIKKVFVQLKH
ncbi:Coenzyme F420 hydrogenase/dehydrogenase, beta subunit C-terminal domain [Marseilla massiliensis]|uniref:Coenzyme F420 hydrogenase/dehydrogenase, beta subunit C-terminal domain n=1 Tax=Marseilla massiliensis TaxID=1841864 RepID=A0A938WQM4_9BACT|nr:Coenzyme F420 hydrogenase/dehydrogenase, beta subunit C-terminal domain [Marseilla massiliensis]MBM6673382.1 Coenzyme F420 hydrogenase/dehydrogenase, beta subunit C-terminal domain [Marseilla massiliensis]